MDPADEQWSSQDEHVDVKEKQVNDPVQNLDDSEPVVDHKKKKNDNEMREGV